MQRNNLTKEDKTTIKKKKKKYEEARHNAHKVHYKKVKTLQ